MRVSSLGHIHLCTPFLFCFDVFGGAYDGTCLLSSAPHTQGRVWGQGVGGVCLLLEWVVTAGPCRVRTEAPSCVPAPCVCFSSSPSPAFLFLLHVHCDSILFSFSHAIITFCYSMLTFGFFSSHTLARHRVFQFECFNFSLFQKKFSFTIYLNISHSLIFFSFFLFFKCFYYEGFV